ncbi:hypothetical protein DFH07DRAFT_779412 [Mycena maculata]|uniref:Uncharacterized protein n=1 Tax=Mycena maculata TaxID=230809 RepID=A0AAD7I9W6_9AGAR|nr:hypothetical protein DFH07DRAFT_779412 [Mycena maculata]
MSHGVSGEGRLHAGKSRTRYLFVDSLEPFVVELGWVLAFNPFSNSTLLSVRQVFCSSPLNKRDQVQACSFVFSPLRPCLFHLLEDLSSVIRNRIGTVRDLMTDAPTPQALPNLHGEAPSKLSRGVTRPSFGHRLEPSAFYLSAEKLRSAWKTSNDAKKVVWDLQVQRDHDTTDAIRQAQEQEAECVRLVAEKEAEAERKDAEKKKPKLADFDENRGVADRITRLGPGADKIFGILDLKPRPETDKNEPQGPAGLGQGVDKITKFGRLSGPETLFWTQILMKMGSKTLAIQGKN